MRRITQNTKCLTIYPPRLGFGAMLYANHMPYLGSSVLIRSTLGVSEPRYTQAVKLLTRIGLETNHINWARSNTDLEKLGAESLNYFKLDAKYGSGISNYFMHLRFNLFIFQRLWIIKPHVIYACDLDTFLPILFYRCCRPVIVIFDQFDPLSARVQNKSIAKVLDIIEYALTMNAHIRISPNLERIPEKLRHFWIEVKNLFQLQLVENNLANQKDGFWLFYGGILSHDRGLIDSLKVINSKSSWHMDIFGQGPVENILVKEAGSNVRIHGHVSHRELMNFAQGANLYLAQYDPKIRNNRLTASNKLFEAAQLGIPLLTSKGTHIGEIVQKYGLGWVVTFGDSVEFERALDECASLTKIERGKVVENLTSFYHHEIEEQNSNIMALENTLANMLNSGRH